MLLNTDKHISAMRNAKYNRLAVLAINNVVELNNTESSITDLLNAIQAVIDATIGSDESNNIWAYYNNNIQLVSDYMLYLLDMVYSDGSPADVQA